jgi:hypothetical protein
MTNFVLVHGATVGGWYWGEVAQCLERPAAEHAEMITRIADRITHLDAQGRGQ